VAPITRLPALAETKDGSPDDSAAAADGWAALTAAAFFLVNHVPDASPRRSNHLPPGKNGAPSRYNRKIP